MKEKILAWIVEYLLKAADQETIEKLMREYVLPFIAKQKAGLYKWLDDMVKDTASPMDDVAAQIIKYILDMLLPA